MFWKTIALFVVAILPTPCVAGILFTAGNDTVIRTVDLDTGTVTDLGSTGLTAVDNIALAFRSDGVLFGFEDRGANRLYTIDTTTGAATLIGSTGISSAGGNPESLTFDATGRLITMEGGGANGEVWELNTSTGLATSSGFRTGVAVDVDGLTTAPVDVTVQGLGTVSAGTHFVVDSGSLYTVDSSTFFTTLIGSVGGNVAWETIAFAADGTLYGGGQNDSINKIDLATLSSTLVATNPDGFFGSAVQIQAIPEPSGIVLLGLGGLMFLGYQRRRENTKPA